MKTSGWRQVRDGERIPVVGEVLVDTSVHQRGAPDIAPDMASLVEIEKIAVFVRGRTYFTGSFAYRYWIRVKCEDLLPEAD